MIAIILIVLALIVIGISDKMRKAEAEAKKQRLADAIKTLTAPKRDEAAATAAAQTIATLMVEANEEQMAKLNSPPVGTFALAYLIEKDKRR